MRKHLWIFLPFLFVGLSASAASLFHYAPDICTSFARGWPLGIIIYPCLCYGRGNVAWIVSFRGLAINATLYTVMAIALYASLKLCMRWLKPRSCRSGVGVRD
ncbi:MAG: hypothetical protein QGD94_06635 [Planctomycetia bacterium]|nr:hypothetical protein [Planctomycetia bacterium]